MELLSHDLSFLSKFQSKNSKEASGSIIASQETVEILASLEQVQPLIKLISNPGTSEDETCVLYMDSEELAKQVLHFVNE